MDNGPIRVRIHILNEEPFDADMEEMPPSNATYIVVKNPHTREGRTVAWATAGATGYIYPLSRIAFIERLIGRRDETEVEKHYRDSTRGM